MRDELSLTTLEVPGLDGRDSGEPRWLASMRAEAEERFRQARWPEPSEEEWRRTDLSALDLDGIAAREAEFPRPALPDIAAAELPRAAADPGLSGELRFEHGICVHRMLAEDLERRGLLLMPLEQAVRDARWAERLEGSLRRGLAASDNRLLLWHYSRFIHGAILYVPRFVEVPAPIRIELVEAEQPAAASFPHLTIVLEEGARVELIALTSGAAGPGHIVNAVTELALGTGSALSIYEAQYLGTEATYFKHASAEVGRDASLRHFDGSLGAGLVKSRIDCSLNGPGSEAFLNGVFFAGGRQHLDLRTVQRHHSTKAMSRANYRGAVRDAARTVFQGLIEVSPGAAGTDAYLSNKNLLLNEGARADSIPSLKIENNDVRCTHGSTTGRIDAQELFYLMSRGLDRSQATELLVLGYFEELLGGTPAAYREPLTARIQDLLRPRP